MLTLTIIAWSARNGNVLAVAAVVNAPSVVTTMADRRLITDAFNIIQPYFAASASVLVSERHANIPSTQHSTPIWSKNLIFKIFQTLVPCKLNWLVNTVCKTELVGY